MKFLSICYWFGHDYHFDKYKANLIKKYSLSNMLERFKDVESYKEYLLSDELLLCKRCKKEVRMKL